MVKLAARGVDATGAPSTWEGEGEQAECFECKWELTSNKSSNVGQRKQGSKERDRQTKAKRQVTCVHLSVNVHCNPRGLRVLSYRKRVKQPMRHQVRASVFLRCGGRALRRVRVGRS